MEEVNALPHLFISQVHSILMHEDVWVKMHQSTIDSNNLDAAMEIARIAVLIGESHELE
jgi:hypothetical protein